MTEEKNQKSESGEQAKSGELNNILQLLGIDQETAKQMFQGFINDLRQQIVEDIKNELFNMKEEVKKEVKEELIKEAQEMAKKLGIGGKFPVQAPNQTQVAKPRLDPNSPFWLILAQLMGGDSSSQILNKLLQLQLTRAIKNTILADAVMDKVYRKVLGKEYERIIKEIEQTIFAESEGE